MNTSVRMYLYIYVIQIHIYTYKDAYICTFERPMQRKSAGGVPGRPICISIYNYICKYVYIYRNTSVRMYLYIYVIHIHIFIYKDKYINTFERPIQRNSAGGVPGRPRGSRASAADSACAGSASTARMLMHSSGSSERIRMVLS